MFSHSTIANKWIIGASVCLSVFLSVPVYTLSENVELLENGEFNNWSGAPSTPELWKLFELSNGSVIEENVECINCPSVHFDYSDVDPVIGIGTEENAPVCNPGEEVDISIYAKQYGFNDQQLQLIVGYDEGESTYMWSPSGNQWVPFDEFATWEVFDDTLSDQWQLYSYRDGFAHVPVCPSVGEMFVLWSSGGAITSASDGVYVDNAHIWVERQVQFATSTPLLTFFTEEYARPTALIAGGFLFLAFFTIIYRFVRALYKWYTSLI